MTPALVAITIGLALGLLPGPAAAADRDVFGLTLGEPLSLPECAKTGQPPQYESLPQALCFQWAGAPSATPGDDEVRVHFPFGKGPAVVKSGVLRVRRIGGRIEAVAFETSGLSGRKEAHELLERKYGKATEVLAHFAKTKVGTPHESYLAIWRQPDIDVGFVAEEFTIDAGRIVIRTPKAVAAGVPAIK
jgi:hypothetical protein